MGYWVVVLAFWFGTLAVAGEDRPVLWEPPAEWCCTLRDIASRLPRNTDAYDSDPITYAHEGSHFLSQGRGNVHGLYVGNGQLRYVPIPPLRTDAVFASMSPERRGPIFDTYRKQGRTEYWRDRPVMLLDEWVAYLRGSQVRREMGIQKRQETDRYCAEMAGYCEQMYNLAKAIPDYDHQPLRDFCRDTLWECRESIPNWDELTQVTFD